MTTTNVDFRSQPGPDQAVGEVILLWMRRGKVTQAQIAAVIGVTQSMVSRKLRGGSPWQLTELVAICDLFGSSLPELFSWETVGAARSDADRLSALPRLDSNQQPSG